MGSSSFAVQLLSEEEHAFMPGIIQVHCNEVDWGHLARRTCDSEIELERRLCKMGTSAGIFGSVDDSSAGVGVHIQAHEGVHIALGRYDPKLRAFVQCKMRVHDAEDDGGTGMKRGAELMHVQLGNSLSFSGEQQQQAHSSNEDLGPANKQRPARRPVFKWIAASSDLSK